MKRLIIALLLLACAHKPKSVEPELVNCRTVCGLSIDQQPVAMCEQLQKAEMQILHAYDRHTEFDFIRTCQSLNGWKIVLHERNFIDLTCTKWQGHGGPARIVF